MTFRYEYTGPEEKPKFESTLFAEGEATFTIENVKWLDHEGNPRITKAGVPKITFKYNVTDSHGSTGNLYHDISAKMRWAFIQLGQAVGKKVYNESATMDWKSLIGCRGRLVIENKETPGFPKRSSIKQYVAMASTAHTTEAIAKVSDSAWDEEDIPF